MGYLVYYLLKITNLNEIIQFLWFILAKQIMDEKMEDKSKESRKKHIKYYKSLSNTIKDVEKEIKSEKEEKIINHLKERIDAMNLDKKRIVKMFPDISEELDE